MPFNIAYYVPRNFVCTFSSETGQLCPRSASLRWLGWAGLGWWLPSEGGRLVCVPPPQLSCSAPAAASRTLSLAQATAPQPRSSDRTPARVLCSSRGNHGQKSAILWSWCEQKPVEEASEWWQLEHSRQSMRMGGLRLSVRTLVSLSVLVATSEAQDAELSAATADRRAAAAQGGNGKYILHS